MQRSDDGGKTWAAVGNKFAYDGHVPGTHQWYDGTPHPWEFKRVWHLEPSLTRCGDGVCGGGGCGAVQVDATAGKNWEELAGLRKHGSGPDWQPGAGGMCLHTIVLDPSRSRSGCLWRSRRRERFGRTMAERRGSRSTRGCGRAYSPNPDAEVGHCVHRIAMHPARPETLFMQKHWDVMRTDDAGENWTEVSGNLPTDFGFVHRRACA